MYFVIDSHVNSTKDGHTNRIHTLDVAHNIMMQHGRNDNGETRVNCNFEVRITDKCDNLELGVLLQFRSALSQLSPTAHTLTIGLTLT